jgi:hypothetical protein
MPLEGVVGLSQSARSSTRSGSKIVRPRTCLASPYRPVGRFICCAIPTRCGGRVFADADTAALVASGLWKSRNAASVYERLDLSAESRKSDLFPTPTRAKGGQ